MSDNILSKDKGDATAPIELDLNALYHPPKAPLTALSLFSTLAPLFGFGWQALTLDRESHLRAELRRRIRKERTDLANLTLTLQLAALLECHWLRIHLPAPVPADLLAQLRRRLPAWQLAGEERVLSAQRVVSSSPASTQKEP